MTDRDISLEEPDLVGARPRAEVERAHSALHTAAAAPQHQTQFTRGALSAYVWAMGRATASPVTGLEPAADGSRPDLEQLVAEIDAAQVQLGDQTMRTIPRDYVSGVHDALVWICTFTDAAPPALEGC